MIGPKIALDISPTLNQNAQRGVGFYTSHLQTALLSEIKNNPLYKNWHLDLINNQQNQSASSYNLVHYPFFDPFALTLPSRQEIPIIVTVHDLVPRQFKKDFPVGLRGEITWLRQLHQLKKVDYIITDSHTSKYAINKVTGIKLDKIYTIYLAADPIYQPTRNLKLLEKVKKKFNLPEKFVLYTGDINVNKNIPLLVNACLKLKYPLYIVGASAVKKTIEHPWTKDLLWLQNQSSPLINRLGFVESIDLAGLYNLATIYCQPSFAEGFGLGLLEAMQSGCPVIYSQDTSLEEIADNSGLSFNPYDQNSLQRTLQTLWSDKKQQNLLRQQGLKRASHFSWQQTALQTLAVYQLALL